MNWVLKGMEKINVTTTVVSKPMIMIPQGYGVATILQKEIKHGGNDMRVYTWILQNDLKV